MCYTDENQTLIPWRPAKGFPKWWPICIHPAERSNLRSQFVQQNWLNSQQNQLIAWKLPIGWVPIHNELYLIKMHNNETNLGPESALLGNLCCASRVWRYTLGWKNNKAWTLALRAGGAGQNNEVTISFRRWQKTINLWIYLNVIKPAMNCYGSRVCPQAAHLQDHCCFLKASLENLLQPVRSLVLRCNPWLSWFQWLKNPAMN